MEWEQGAQHTESDEDEGEEDVLNITRNTVISCNRCEFEGVRTAIDAIEVVNTQQSENQQGRTSHQHQRQLHG